MVSALIAAKSVFGFMEREKERVGVIYGPVIRTVTRQ